MGLFIIFAVALQAKQNMEIYIKIRKDLIDRKLRLPVVICCNFLLFFFLFLFSPVRAHSAPLSAKMLMEKGDSCRFEWKYKKALHYYQKAYADRSVSKDVNMKLQLLERIMRTHDILRHWKEMPESSYRLYILAKGRGDSVHTAMALFMRGKRLHSLGQKQEGLQVALDALGMMKRTDYAQKDLELSYFYAFLAKMYGTDGNYDEALRMSQEQERYIKSASKCHSKEWYRHNMLRVYYIRVEILDKMGRLAEADKIYLKQGLTPNFTDPFCSTAVLNYYRLRGMNEEALQFLQAAMKNICEDGDTLGRNMQRLMKDMGDFYFNMGEYQQAAEYYAGTSRLADTLASRSLNNLSAEVHKAIDNERVIAKQKMRFTIVIACTIILVIVFLLGLRQGLIARKRNQTMTATIRRLMHYRNIAIHNGNVDEMGKNRVVDVPDEELQRFEEADKRIMKEMLFTDPDFGRDDLIRLIGVDKNALPTLLKKITGYNVAGYINVKRMEYAVSLIRQHPEYTLESIAEACGIKSSATFIRNFKLVFDMTPSEFRKQL